MKDGNDACVRVSVRVDGPAADGLVVGAPDSRADCRTQPRDAARAQAVDVPLAEQAIAGVGVAGDGLQDLVVALAKVAVVVDDAKVDAVLAQRDKVGDGQLVSISISIYIYMLNTSIK